MGVLYAKVGIVWVPVTGSGEDEVVIASDPPDNPNDTLKLWVDSDVPEVMSWINGAWVPVSGGSGTPGPPGPEGPPGPPGTLWFTGEGPPEEPFPNVAARAGDLYLDKLTGDYYRLTSVITPVAMVPAGSGVRLLPPGVVAMV